MAAVTPSLELYDWIKENRPDILEWCEFEARWQHCPVEAIVSYKELMNPGNDE